MKTQQSIDQATIVANPLFQANLAAFEKWAPEVHAALSTMEATHSQLVVDPEGSVDVHLAGQPFYGCDAVAFAEAQLTAYFRKPDRVFINEPSLKDLHGHVGDYCTRVLAQMSRMNVAPDPGSVGEDSFYVIGFGVGLGLYVETLIERSKCNALILIEPNIENIYHSLAVSDWARIFAEAENEDRRISFVIQNESEAITRSVRLLIHGNNPAMLDGVYVYNHYRTRVLDNARAKILETLYLNVAGLGFFEDEITMTANTAENIGRAPVAILDRQLPALEVPVLIVGSGPSLDRDLDFIADNAHRAMIVSLGSATRCLLRREIRPDYHVEIENVEINADTVRVVAEEFGLTGTTLLGAITVRPGMVEQFDDAILFFRDRTSGTMLFADGMNIISPTGPTVANAALGAAIRMGFREVYLFGVDMGSTDEDRFHSAGSFYESGHLEEYGEAQVELVGNFGGDAYADRTLNWSRRALETVLQASPDVRCFNCSAGARIEGAVPRLARTVRLTGGPIDRGATKDRIRAGLSVFSDDRRRRLWSHADRRREVRELVGGLRRVLDGAREQSASEYGWMGELIDMVRYDAGRPEQLIRSYFFGTLTLMLGCTYWYERRFASEGDRRSFRRIALSEIGASVAQMAERLEQLLDEVDSFFAGTLAEVSLPPHELDMAWRKQLAEALAAEGR